MYIYIYYTYIIYIYINKHIYIYISMYKWINHDQSAQQQGAIYKLDSGGI